MAMRMTDGGAMVSMFPLRNSSELSTGIFSTTDSAPGLSSVCTSSNPTNAISPYNTHSASRCTASVWPKLMMITPIANRLENVMPMAASCLTRVFLWINSINTVVTIPATSAPMNIGTVFRLCEKRNAMASPGRTLWLIASPTSAIRRRIR